jgi:thiamine pyrophosphate-dependent acetolactate synthase large subunit-like protein
MNEGNDPLGAEKPRDAGRFPMGWGSDVVAEMLRRLELDFVALNPGASYRALHDSIVNYLGNEKPQILLCHHEEHAVAIAHGYAKVTGRPMGVLLHTVVGLMHASMAIFNAWCDRVPVIILGAVGPLDASRRRPWIDWIHTVQDLGELVRNYTKWDDQPASVSAAMESLLRASQIARTAPQGPVYICLDVAMQESRIEGSIRIPDVSRYRPGLPQAPSQESIERAARLLCDARRPLILAGRVSRSRTYWDLRVKLAESLGARVLTDIKVGAAFPTNHPLHGPASGHFLSQDSAALIRAADVILSLDWIDLAGTLKRAWDTDDGIPPVIDCSMDCYSHRGWSMDHQGLHPADLRILCEPDILLRPLLSRIAELRGARGPASKSGWQIGPAQPSTDEKEALAGSGQVDIGDIARCLTKAAGNRDVTLIRLPIGWPGGVWDFHDPLDFLGQDGGAGIGSGPGMSVGSALALRGSGRLPVAVLGDGDYLMGVNALWTAAHYRIPLMIVVANNRSYFNDEAHQERMARERDRPVENKGIGLRIDHPPVDLAGMARAQGLQAEGPVTCTEDLERALVRGVQAIERGEACVIDVLIPRSTKTAPPAPRAK